LGGAQLWAEERSPHPVMPPRPPPAVVAAARQGRLDLVRAAVHAGADIDGCCPLSRSTALMVAAKRGDAEMVRFLVHSKASLNLVNVGGWTAKDEASTGGNEDTVAFLAERGAKNAEDLPPAACYAMLDLLFKYLAKLIEVLNRGSLLFVSLGNDCTVKFALVHSGWAQPTYPFDWLRSLCLPQLMVALRTRMADICHEDAVTLGRRTFDVPPTDLQDLHSKVHADVSATWLYDNAYQLVFKHEPTGDGVPLPVLAAQVRDKYQRRARRLSKNISQARKVIFVRSLLQLEEGEVELQQCHRELTSMFPDVPFVLIAVTTAEDSASWSMPPGTEVYPVKGRHDAALVGVMPMKLVSTLQWKHGPHGALHRMALFILMRLCCWIKVMKLQRRIFVPRSLFKVANF
jgi:hypothetical protein